MRGILLEYFKKGLKIAREAHENFTSIPVTSPWAEAPSLALTIMLSIELLSVQELQKDEVSGS